jgi:hypothetical protein
MSGYRESRGGGGWIFATALAGMYVGHIAGHIIGESPGERVRNAQLDNAQIEVQLDNVPGINGVNHLLVDDHEHTLQFNAVDANGVAVICTAKYEVNGEDNNRIASLAGDLACTQTVPAPK